MRKPKIKIDVYNAPLSVEPKCQYADIWFGGQLLVRARAFPSRKEARDWAKEWCRTVGAALLEKGNDTAGAMRKLRSPKCTCDQQETDLNCPARKAGYKVGSDMVCSIPPKEKGK